MRGWQLIVVFLCIVAHGNQCDAQANKKVAFLVGINDYKKPGFHNLSYAQRDVVEMGKELGKHGFEVTTLLGSKATKVVFESTIQKLVAPLSKNDLILVMLAGHGQQKGGDDASFCPYDAVIDDASSLVSLSQLLNKTLATNVGTKLLLIDACRNDPDPGRGRTVGIQGKVIALPEDTAIMFSCRSGQQSFENDKIQHGVFTYCLLDCMRNGGSDGQVSWFGLVSQVNKKMSSKEMLQYVPEGRRQTPIPAGGVPYTVLARVSPDAPTTPQMKLPEGLPKSIESSVGMKLVLIPPGEFTMGGSKTPSEIAKHFGIDKAEYFESEYPRHNVKISRPFYMANTEVTQKQWKILEEKIPWESERLVSRGDDYPVANITWYEAIVFCERLTARDHELGKLTESQRYRLPTEAEWEYACRAGTQTIYSSGDTPESLREYAWFDLAPKETVNQYARPVARKKANAFGLFDMHGNVTEWCAGHAYEDRVNISSGSYGSDGDFVRSEADGGALPQTKYNSFGFRIARTLSE